MNVVRSTNNYGEFEINTGEFKFHFFSFNPFAPDPILRSIKIGHRWLCLSSVNTRNGAMFVLDEVCMI